MHALISCLLFTIYYLKGVKSPYEAWSEILVRGIWKASDHENCFGQVAVGFPHLYELFKSPHEAFFSKGAWNNLICSCLIFPRSSRLTPWFTTWKNPHSDEAFAIFAIQSSLLASSDDSSSFMSTLRSISGSSHSSSIVTSHWASWLLRILPEWEWHKSCA